MEGRAYLWPGMKGLNLPEYDVKLRRVGDISQIFDEVRKKWLVLTPEEWVRQHFVHYLHDQKAIPLSFMAIEKGLEVYGLKKRADIVCYNKRGEAAMIVECKAPEIKLNTEVFAQAATYNLQLKVPFLVVTNGMQHYAAHIDLKNKKYNFLEELPDNSAINAI